MPPSLRPRAGVTLALSILPLFAGCGAPSGGGGGGGSTSAASGAFTGAGAQGAATLAHTQVALAALGSDPAPLRPLSFEPLAVDRWNELIARTWPGVRTMVDPLIEAQLRQRLTGLSGSDVAVQSIRGVVIDTAAPVALRGGGAGPALSLEVQVPRAPDTWTLGLTADITATVRTTVLGAPLVVVFSTDVTVEVTAIRVEQTMALDAADPVRPLLASAGASQLALRIAIRSNDPLVGAIVTPLTRLLEPVVRAALLAGAVVVQQQVAGLASHVPAVPWGLGGPLSQPVPGAPDFAPFAEGISEDLRRDHMPWDIVLVPRFDQPGYGNGSVVGYKDYGDAALVTGQMLMSESLRYDVTGDPRALLGAQRSLRGINACLDVVDPTDGLLGRCAVPISSPHIADFDTAPDYVVGFFEGVPMGTLGNVSRDAYLGSFIGLTQAYLRVPSLRPKARELITRMVDYFERNDWNAYKIRKPELAMASPLSQTPGVVFGLVKSGLLVDPARFAAAHDRVKGLASILWLVAWAGSREVHESYYKFHLLSDEILLGVSSETDPALYREQAKTVMIVRDAIAHHENAWFDAVCGMTIPGLAAPLGARVEIELERQMLRPRRDYTIVNSTDPAIAKVLYHSPTTPFTGAQWISVHPIPIERRVPGDFLWTRKPFALDGTGDPAYQYPGVDFLMPYWTARAYGMTAR